MAERTEDQQRVLWFIKLRWLAIALILVVFLYLKLVGKFEMPFWPPLTVIILTAIYNSLYPFLALRWPFFSGSGIFTDIRTVADLIVVTLMIHFTGGIESPFIMLYLLELMALSLFRFTASAYYLAGLATIMYLSNCFLEAFFIIPHYRLSPLSGTLYISPSYLFSIGFALFFTSALVIYMASFLAEKFEQRRLQIEALSKAKAEFMNDVMHETKSPLTSIIGYSDILLRGNFGEVKAEQRNPLEIIQRQSKRILDMVNNLLDIARLESGRTKLELKEADFSETVMRVTEQFKPQLDSAKLDLVMEIEPDLPALPFDESKLEEVMTNLVSNAIKFSKPGSKIFISLQASETALMVSVRDEGLGIEADNMPKIFEKFHRASAEAAKVRGTGLGLALSKTIVEMHGGRLWAASAGRDKGSVFHFTLPLTKPA